MKFNLARYGGIFIDGNPTEWLGFTLDSCCKYNNDYWGAFFLYLRVFRLEFSVDIWYEPFKKKVCFDFDHYWYYN